MTGWLSRALLLDLRLVDGNKGKRQIEDDDDLSVVWTYLVPHSRRPSTDKLQECLDCLSKEGFLLLPHRRSYRVYPADIDLRERTYDQPEDVVMQLATRGGGVLLYGYGVRIGFVSDPMAAARAQIIRRTGLLDQITFGEYSLWMEDPRELDEVTQELVRGHFVGAQLALEELLAPEFGYSIWTDEMSAILKRWRAHCEVDRRQMPSELFWYQYFGREYAERVAVEDYERVGLDVDRRPNGTMAVSLVGPVGEDRRFLACARRLWPHTLLAIEID